MILAVIFSRDRACQLDLLLRSLDQNAPEAFETHVIWRASSGSYTDGYGRCMAEHPRTRFQREDGLVYQTRWLIGKSEGHVAFFTDDDVLFRPLPAGALHEHALNREDVLAFSLRLGENTTFCYPHARRQKVPRVRWNGDLWLWNWQEADQDFAYPCSLDGHIFRRGDLLGMIDGQHFSSPNFLEDVLVTAAEDLKRPLMASYPESKLVGIPANKVSETHVGNRAGEQHPMSAADLNRRYLAGERIDPSAMDFSGVRGAHHELPYVLS